MKIISAFLANWAELAPARGLSVKAAFPERWGVPEIPHSVALPIIIVSQFERSEIGEDFPAVVEGLSARGKVIGSDVVNLRRESDYVHSAGSPWYGHEILGLPVTFTDVGAHKIDIWMSGEKMATYPFGVLFAQSA